MYAGARGLTLADALFPWTSAWRSSLLVLAGSVVVCLAAQLSVPLYGEGVLNPAATAIGSLYAGLGVPLPSTPVPITGQTFAVLLIGALLGGRLGFVCLLAYLAEGLAGLPVYSLGKSAWNPSAVPGVPWILGPTAGYLFSLPLAAYAVGLLAERGWDRRFTTTCLAMVVGNAAIYLVGMGWLSLFVGVGNVLSMGLLPFIPGDLVKLLLATLLLPGGWAMLRWTGLRAGGFRA